MYNNSNNRNNTPSHHADHIFFKVVKVAILFIMCIVLIFSSYKLYRKYHRTRLALVDAETELAKLQDSEQSINKSIDRLSSTEGIEYEVRDKYRVTKQNEKMIVVIDNQVEPTAIENTTSTSKFVKFKEWLYNL
jgi:cell division protein FtsB